MPTHSTQHQQRHPISQPLNANTKRLLRIQVQGIVQGVGFRPFVYRLASELGLTGWVCNSDRGLDIEIEGEISQLTAFQERLLQDRPPHSHLAGLDSTWLDPCNYERFEIRASHSDTSSKSAWLLPDLATCADCLQELFDPSDRRYRYPFINCTHCGPRYSIQTVLPYDRPNTTMRSFRMCLECQEEYDSPNNRRFHAQPNACRICGPQLELLDKQGQPISMASGSDPLREVGDRIRGGDIIALKGLGGFHLVVDARNEAAVQRLRDRKYRPSKPLAVMYPSLEILSQDCCISLTEKEQLLSAAAPIVLLTPQANPQIRLAASIAPHQSTLGVMLPYTPLHHLLLAELGFPIVATSGNRSGEPICIDNSEALANLGSIADASLVHNRPIARPVDDSVVRVMADRAVPIRRARGYAPVPLQPSSAEDLPCLLAVGGHLKNTVALSLPDRILVSQHLGDLDTAETVERVRETVTNFLHLYGASPTAIACDAHPDYASTQLAHHLGKSLQVPVIPIQHHYAHILSAIAEHHLEPPVLGVAWDGNGYGLDGTVWGGEFLAVPDREGFDRVAHLRSFSLPGGDRAAREPRRSALGLLYETFGDSAFGIDNAALRAFSDSDLKLLTTMLRRQVNSPRTSSVGRLFDAFAAIVGLCQQSTYEGEAAMQFESAIAGPNTTGRYPYTLTSQDNGPLLLDWEPMLQAILADLDQPIGQISARFHNTLSDAIVAIARRVGISQVLLTGGCFQNRYLLETSIRGLQAAGFTPHWHQNIPSNDGGLAVGQILGATWKLQHRSPGGAPCV
ncbi:MAG: carbamoyltransferase HypF [Synechococcus sp.]